MRIVVDIDGTLCPIKEKDGKYEDLQPLPGAAEAMKELKAAGHYIILQTARNMATQDSNLGKVVKNIGKVTLEWLDKHDIVYDEIYFGKPNGHIYIDDRALRFQNWKELSVEQIEQLGREK
jgi:capsule biosynthesis phosphatase